MTNEEREKQIKIANMIIDTINDLKTPMLIYRVEKDVTKEALKNYINMLEQQPQKWIPVTEKLPEPYTEVLVNITYKGDFEGIDLARYIPDGSGYIDRKWDTQIDWIEDHYQYYQVTAWMPIPEPYKESEDKEWTRS